MSPARVLIVLVAFLCVALGAGCKRSAPQPESAATSEAPAKVETSTSAAFGEPEQQGPYPDPRTDVAHGKFVYGRMCAICHGENGEGYKADQAPALNQQDFLESVTDDYLGFAIADGRKGTTMSAWMIERGGPLSADDIESVIAFIRSWQKVPPATLDESPVMGDAETGKKLFAEHCERCHGPKAPHVRILGRQLLSTVKNGYLRHAIRAGRPPTPMPAFYSTLGDQGVEDVVAYMRTFPAWPTPEQPVAPPPPLPLGPVPLNPKGPEPLAFQSYPRMTSVDVVAQALASKSRMALLDARVPTDFAEMHIAGAVSVPFYDPEPYLRQLPRDAWLVTYCACPHAESGALAQRLTDAGFNKVSVLDEGLNVWIERGYPTRSGVVP